MDKYGDVDYLMIGDTIWDKNHAKEAGMPFLGVNYGWSDFKSDGFPVVQSVKELREFLIR
jgi:phosphoglycolate phosphatase-like HAD superfamily hydrolase